jgi:hypothetical protein
MTKSEKNEKKEKKEKVDSIDKKKFKDSNPELVMVRSDDLRELVTETVTKLMAEDILDMDDDGIIDLKKEVELKKKVKQKKQKNQKKAD